jgi:hypothetical protein
MGKKIEDEIIVRISLEDPTALDIGTKRRQTASQSLMQEAYDLAQIAPEMREIPEQKIDRSDPFIFNMGKIIEAGKLKQANAIAIGDGGKTFFYGVGDELWRTTEFSEPVEIGKVGPYERNDGELYQVVIRRLEIDSQGRVHGLAWEPPDYSHYEDTGGDNYSHWRQPCIYFRVDDGITIAIKSQLDSSNWSWFFSGEYNYRGSRMHTTNFNEIGQRGAGGAIDCGENAPIPYPQVVGLCGGKGHSAGRTGFAPKNVGGLTSSTLVASFYEWNFNSHEHYLQQPCWLAVEDITHESGIDPDQSPIGFRYTFGQSGMVYWDHIQEKFVVGGTTSTASNFMRMYEVESDGSAGALRASYGYSPPDEFEQSLCCTFHPAGTTTYHARAEWSEEASTLPSICDIVEAYGSTSANTLFRFWADSAEVGSSIVGNEEWCCVIHMEYHAGENSLHCSIFDRSTMQYHYGIYDITNDKLYTTQTGDNFTFDNGMLIGSFGYDEVNEWMFSVCSDPRGYQKTAYVIRGTLSGTDIILEKIGTPSDSHKNSASLILGTDKETGRVAGIVGPSWTQVADNVSIDSDPQYEIWFASTWGYPRVPLASVTDESMREALVLLSQMGNQIVIPPASSKIWGKVKQKVTSGSSQKTISGATNLIKVKDFERYKFRFDGVRVSWNNPITKEKGNILRGRDGWNKKVLRINNSFVQNRNTAEYVLDQYGDFYLTLLQAVKFISPFLIEVEIGDLVDILARSNTYVDPDKIWFILATSLDWETKENEIKAIEIG